ncbi:MAG: quinoprotein relay system zinc metallohydrolase 2 [Dongiaceae bacterium]
MTRPLAAALGRRLALLRAAFIALVLVAAAWRNPAGADELEPLPVTEIAPGIFVHQGEHGEATPDNAGGIANIGFIVGREAVAVIDTGGSAVEGGRLRAAIRVVTDRPIRYVINTHMHPDHVLGNAAFVEDGAAIIGHAKLPAALASRAMFYLDDQDERLGPVAAGTQAIMPTVLVEREMAIDLGSRVLRLVAHVTAHTDNDLSVFDIQTTTLWLSDLLFVDRIPAIDGSLKGWLEVIAELRGVPAARAVPGHGPVVADWPAALDPEERYLRTLRDEIRDLLRQGGTMEQAVESVGLSEGGNWLLFDDYHGRNIVTAFAALEWE